MPKDRARRAYDRGYRKPTGEPASVVHLLLGGCGGRPAMRDLNQITCPRCLRLAADELLRRSKGDAP